jgi:hypothetical protein
VATEGTPWWMELLLAVIGSTSILGGIGWWVRTRHEDRVNERLALATEIRALQQEVKDLLQDRIKYEMVRRESSDQTMAVLNKILEIHGSDKTQVMLEEIVAILRTRGQLSK